jgi:hypothetical protein
VVAVAALLALPALVAALSLLGRHWYASGDQAYEVLRIADVGGRHTPLVGAPSRFGWYHPGPLLYLLLAPWERMLGETGVLAGTAVLNAAALVGVAVVARRRGGIALLLWTGLLVTALVHSLGPSVLLDPWNPWAGVLPFLLFVMLAWSVMCGDLACLPWAVGVGSFVVQTHVGFGLLVVGLLIVALVVAALGPSRGRLGRWVAVSGVVVVVLWLPPLIQQAAGHPGNLAEVARYFLHPQYTAQQVANYGAGSTVGWTTAFGVMGKELTPPGPWLTGQEINTLGFVANTAAWPAVLVILATMGAGLLAWRRGARDAALLAGTAVVLASLGLVATARVSGILAPYLVRWWWVVTLTVWMAIGWCLAEALHLRRLMPAAGVLAAAGSVSLTAATVVAAVPAPLPLTPASDAIAHLASSTAGAVSRGSPTLVHWTVPETLSGVGPGVFTELDLEGLDVVAPSFAATAVGSWRAAPPASFRGVINVVAAPDPTFASLAVQPPQGSRLVASYDPLSAQERQEAVVLQQRIRSALGPRAPQGALVVSFVPYDQHQLVSQGASPSDVARLAALQARGSPYLVYYSP